MKNEDVRIQLDFNIQVDKFIAARRPDIDVVKKKVITNIAVPGDVRTQIEKI